MSLRSTPRPRLRGGLPRHKRLYQRRPSLGRMAEFGNSLIDFLLCQAHFLRPAARFLSLLLPFGFFPLRQNSVQHLAILFGKRIDLLQNLFDGGAHGHLPYFAVPKTSIMLPRTLRACPIASMALARWWTTRLIASAMAAGSSSPEKRTLRPTRAPRMLGPA